MKKYIIPFQEITTEEITEVGEKNASMGELINHLTPMGVNVPDGFAITDAAFMAFLEFNSVSQKLLAELSKLDVVSLENDARVSSRCRDLISEGLFPEKIERQIIEAYHALEMKYGLNPAVAVRSSIIAKDDLKRTLAGHYETILNIRGPIELLQAIKKCYGSLYNEEDLDARLSEYDNNKHAGLSVGIQLMVGSSKGSSGVAFCFDGSDDKNEVIYVSGTWGLGQGEFHDRVNADEFYISKKALLEGVPSLLLNVRGLKEEMLVAGEEEETQWIKTTAEKQESVILRPTDLELLGLWFLAIEKHYGCPVKIEWAKDDEGELYIVQVRKEQIAKGTMRREFTSSLMDFKSFIHSDLAADIPLLHRESLDWLRHILFMNDEVLFLEKLMTTVLPGSQPTILSQKISQELSYLMDHSILQLHQRIIEHESILADIIKSDTPERQVIYRESHSDLKSELIKYNRVFLRLRKDIFLKAKECFHKKQ